MSKFVMKSVAVGVLVASFGSAAIAADPVGISAAKISGHKPFVTAKGDITAAATGGHVTRGYVLTTKKSDGTAHKAEERLAVGDKVILTYVLADQDGDLDATTGAKNSSAAKSITFFYYNKAQAKWIEAPAGSVDTTISGNNTVVTLSLDANAEGASSIGMKVLEKTLFGAPAGNIWYQTDNIFGKGDLSIGTDGGDNGSETEPTQPGGNGNGGTTTKPGAGGEENIDTEVTPPCDPDDAACKPDGEDGGENGGGTIEPSKDTLKVAIYQVSTDGTINKDVDYTTDANALPTVGEKYTAVVKAANGTESGVSYTYTWFAEAGSNSAAGGTTALTSDVQLAAGKEFTIPVNSAVQGVTAEAGLQGFSLKVVATTK